VVIEEVRVNGKPLAANERAANLRLGPGRQMVEFRYTATSLVAPSKVRFKCQLEGVESQWREAETSRSAMYDLTAPGDYRFRVTACNNDGVWSETGASVGLTVAPYVWQTWWFKIALFGGTLLAVAGTVGYIERGRMRRKLEQLEMQQTVERERARIARDIHD